MERAKSWFAGAALIFWGSLEAVSGMPRAKIALATSLTGTGEFAGRALVEAVQFALDETNANGEQPMIEVKVYDDQSREDGAQTIARQIVSEDPLVVIGPSLTTCSLAAGPIYAEAGIASIVPTAHGDEITNNATTFRTVFSTGEIGDSLANYLYHILDGRQAIVISKDNGYGRPFAAGFKRAADRLGIETTYHSFKTAAERDEVARLSANESGQTAIFLGMTYDDAVPVLVELKRRGVKGSIFGTATMARASFADLFHQEPEEHGNPGYFTNGVYAVSPMILDSANADTLAFSDRYLARYHHEPSWETVQAYDATRLAVSAVRAAFAASKESSADAKSLRNAVLKYLASLTGPDRAVAGLTSPVWFTPGRVREQAVRIGRFHGALLESAPLQLVPVLNPTAAEIAAGDIIDVGSGHYVRRQQVVYSGIFLNEVPRVDIAPSTFTADFYIWIRFARNAGAGTADAADIDFPDLVRGTFDRNKPAVQADLDDGTTYRLWRMRGDFKNDFDLHHYPADRQTLALRFFNARAASDRIVYVQDRRTSIEVTANTGVPTSVSKAGGIVGPAAFRNLTQWQPTHVRELRDSLVTQSDLGDARLIGLDRVRELSGFKVTVELRRLLLATIVKTLLPLGLMTLIMYAALHFPHGLVKEKITVTVTAALSGAVLLSSINSQLGNVGYILAVEYVFYVYFTLCLLCIVSILAAEKFRAGGKQKTGITVDRFSRYAFLLVAGATVISACVVVSQW